jgi:hypothetical protein
MKKQLHISLLYKSEDNIVPYTFINVLMTEFAPCAFRQTQGAVFGGGALSGCSGGLLSPGMHSNPS